MYIYNTTYNERMNRSLISPATSKLQEKSFQCFGHETGGQRQEDEQKTSSKYSLNKELYKVKDTVHIALIFPTEKVDKQKTEDNLHLFSY
jgi:hypothetical protein